MAERPELLDLALSAHGGLERWQAAREIRVRAACGGFALIAKWKRGAFRDYELSASTSEPRAVISPYPSAGRRGVFTPDLVRIELDDGSLEMERRDPRRLFPGVRRRLWWDDLDLLYFGGYAMWNYLMTPFLFTRPGFVLREIEPWRERAESWRRLAVSFPRDVPTHSREQVFHFDESGLLRRLDYTAEVFGGWARAAHYCGEHRVFDGLVFPTRRRVYPRRPDGRPLGRPTIIWIDIADVTVSPRG